MRITKDALTGMPRMRLRSIRLPFAILTAAISSVALSSCHISGDSILQPQNRANKIPWSIPVNYKAVTMLVGEAIQLTATPMTIEGEPMTGLPPIKWSTSDTALKVDATGKVTSSREVRNGLVFAQLVDPVNEITVWDTTIVTTVDTAFRFSGYQLLPAGGVGDTVIPMAVANNFNAVLLDESGQPLRDESGALIAPTAFYSTNAPYASLQVYTSPYPRAVAYNVGTFTIRATSYLFGTLYSDSMIVRITYPLTVTLNIQRAVQGTAPSPSAMSQTDITISVGGRVNFLNQNPTLPADIKFDDLSQVVGGDIPVVSTTSPGSPVMFPNAGKFTYQSSLGFRGTITVVPQ